MTYKGKSGEERQINTDLVMFGTGRSPATQHMGLEVSPVVGTGWSCVLAGSGWPPLLACPREHVWPCLLPSDCCGRQPCFVARAAQKCHPALPADSPSAQCIPDAGPSLCVTMLTVLHIHLTPVQEHNSLAHPPRSVPACLQGVGLQLTRVSHVRP